MSRVLLFAAFVMWAAWSGMDPGWALWLTPLVGACCCGDSPTFCGCSTGGPHRLRYRVTVSGIVDLLCNNCDEWYNGTFILDLYSEGSFACTYRDTRPEGGPCTGDADIWTWELWIGWSDGAGGCWAVLYPASDGTFVTHQEYRLRMSAWNYSGNNAIPAYVESITAECFNWPLAITVEPL